ncbi:MAG: hypothetical protein WCS93_06735 [Candidatus Delongbacteria bacterium]
MANLIDTIIDGSLQVKYDALVVGDLDVKEYIHTKGIRYSYQELGVQTDNFVINCDLSSIVSFTVGANITIGFNVTIPTGMTKEIVLIVKNGGAYTFTWPDSIAWVKTVEPVLAEDGIDIISLILLEDGLHWLGSVQTSNSIFVNGGSWD